MAESTKKANVIRLKGLEKVETAPLAADGGLGTEWTEWGSTTPDSFVITKGDDSVTEEFIEEAEDAIDEITTQKGLREVTWSTKNVHSDVFLAIAGGSFDQASQTWSEDANADAREVSLRATSKTGIVVTIARVKIRISGDLKFSKNALSQLTIKGKQLAPLKAGVKGFTIQYPNASGE